jgi:3-hydroxyacyl-CoA dehydrogenase
MVLAGYLGRKSGTGFYRYDQRPPVPNDALVTRG